MAEQTLHCPKCATPIDINNALSKQLEQQYELQFQQRMGSFQHELAQKQKALADERQKLEDFKKNEREVFQKKLQEEVQREKLQLAQQIKADVAQESAMQMQMMQAELQEKSLKLQELAKTQAEIEKLKREKDEMRVQFELEAERKLSQQLQQEREKISQLEKERMQQVMQDVQAKNELLVMEYQKKLADQAKLLDELKRKQEQGSMQLQGEVQELAIEQWLHKHFPMDDIVEIKKGERGADCLQVVNTHYAQQCGSIYYESKRTKNFGADWIEKFKDDMRARGATVGILVTEAMPKDMERMGLKEGVWVCNFSEFKSLCFVLRENVLSLYQAMRSQENKGDKMVMLYDYLTSHEFRAQVEAIVEGFTQMQNDLMREKSAMERIWKQREKQIEKVLLNTTHMYSSVRGIAGAAVQSIALLELDAVDPLSLLE